MLVLQQRAAVVKGKQNEFADLLVKFIEEEKIAETICLTSSFAFERLDSQLVGLEINFITILLYSKRVHFISPNLDHRFDFCR